jgi:hypothetical protein
LSKTTKLIALGLLCLTCILVIAVLKGGSDSATIRNAINDRLVGTNLTYSSIAGVPMNFTIGADDIKSVEEASYEGDPAWKVRVGEGLAWDLIMSADGRQILDTRQLFVT